MHVSALIALPQHRLGAAEHLPALHQGEQLAIAPLMGFLCLCGLAEGRCRPLEALFVRYLGEVRIQRAPLQQLAIGRFSEIPGGIAHGTGRVGAQVNSGIPPSSRLKKLKP